MVKFLDEKTELKENEIKYFSTEKFFAAFSLTHFATHILFPDFFLGSQAKPRAKQRKKNSTGNFKICGPRKIKELHWIGIKSGF